MTKPKKRKPRLPPIVQLKNLTDRLSDAAAFPSEIALSQQEEDEAQEIQTELVQRLRRVVNDKSGWLLLLKKRHSVTSQEPPPQPRDRQVERAAASLEAKKRARNRLLKKKPQRPPQ
jgi:hypothetical protein